MTYMEGSPPKTWPKWKKCRGFYAVCLVWSVVRHVVLMCMMFTWVPGWNRLNLCISPDPFQVFSEMKWMFEVVPNTFCVFKAVSHGWKANPHVLCCVFVTWKSIWSSCFTQFNCWVPEIEMVPKDRLHFWERIVKGVQSHFGWMCQKDFFRRKSLILRPAILKVGMVSLWGINPFCLILDTPQTHELNISKS